MQKLGGEQESLEITMEPHFYSDMHLNDAPQNHIGTLVGAIGQHAPSRLHI